MPSQRPRLETWQWNQYVITLAAFTAFVGFSFVNPFLPLYIHQELGVADLKEVAVWSGIIFASSPLLAAFSAPVWGWLADRFGYKVMVQRALFTFVFILAGMAFVQSVGQLLILRIALGLLGGFSAMSMALITSLAPPDRTAQAVGMRPTFFVSAGLCLAALLLMTLIFREDRSAIATRRAERRGVSLRQVASAPAFLAVAIALFLVQAVDQSFGPVLPLFVAQLEGSTTNAASLTGLIVSSAAAATAIAATVLGRVATRYPPRRLFLLTLLGGAIICIPLALSQTTGALWTWRIVLGLLAGGSTTLAYTLGSLTIPPQIRGSGLGLLTSATLIGGAVSPLMAGTLATYDLRWVFGLDAIIYAAVFMWVLLVLGPRAPLEGEAA